MPRKKWRQKKKRAVYRPSDTVTTSVIELVPDLANLNNNVSCFDTQDEILLESIPNNDYDLQTSQHLKTSLDEKGIPSVRRKVQLKSKKKVGKMRYLGSKFERIHDTISLDRFFTKKALKRKKMKSSPKIPLIKFDQVTDGHLDRGKEVCEDKDKDVCEKNQNDTSLEELGNIDDFITSEDFEDLDIELDDHQLTNSISDETLIELIKKYFPMKNEDYSDENICDSLPIRKDFKQPLFTASSQLQVRKQIHCDPNLLDLFIAGQRGPSRRQPVELSPVTNDI